MDTRNKLMVLFLTVFLSMVFMGNVHAVHPNKRQNIVVKLDTFDAATWEDPVAGGHNWQAACMAMGLANHMLGKKRGPFYTNQVTLFLNLGAVELADTLDVPDLSIFTCSNGRNLQQFWDNLVSKGVSIVVCPGCAVIGGVTPDIVRDGAHIGDMSSMQRLFLEADKVIDF